MHAVNEVAPQIDAVRDVEPKELEDPLFDAGYGDIDNECPAEIPAMTHGTVIAGNALNSWSVEDGAKHVEVVLHTDGRQLNAKIELLNAPNNPKQVYEVFTNNGDLNRLVVCFDIPEAGNTIRIINLATVEFPFYASINQVG